MDALKIVRGEAICQLLLYACLLLRVPEADVGPGEAVYVAVCATMSCFCLCKLLAVPTLLCQRQDQGCRPSFQMTEHNLTILNWNVRGLNCPNRRSTVHETIAATPCHIVCLQESKMENVDSFTAAHIGGQRLKSFAQRPADGTRGGILHGGILLLWDEDVVQLSNVHFGTYYLSALVTLRSQTDNSTSFKLTAVYGPTRGNLKDAFFGELVSEKPPPGTMWLVTGDFNQIYRARDKNRANADCSRIVRFRNALNSCELKEIHLQNKRFTWSNG